MRGRTPDPLVLTPQDTRALHALLQDGKTPLRIARRAQILLGRAEAYPQVARLGTAVGQSRATVWRVCERYRQAGLHAALHDAPRAGRPRLFPHRHTAAH